MRRYHLILGCVLCVMAMSIPHRVIASHLDTQLECGTKADAQKIAKKLKKDQLITSEKKAVKSIMKRCRKK
jgi:hypothetical protein